MARQVFYSFHFKPDCWRTNQVRHIGSVEGEKPVSGNDWEDIQAKGHAAVHKWIDAQLKRKSCAIVLIGKETSERPYVEYEIIKAWNEGKGVLGIYIHNLKDKNRMQSAKGKNPFDNIVLDVNGKKVKLSGIVKAYNSQSTVSTTVYKYIEDNIADWVEKAIEIRNKYS